VQITAQLRPVSQCGFSSWSQSFRSFCSFVAVANVLPSPSGPEILLDGLGTLVMRLTAEFRVIHCEPRLVSEMTLFTFHTRNNFLTYLHTWDTIRHAGHHAVLCQCWTTDLTLLDIREGGNFVDELNLVLLHTIQNCIMTCMQTYQRHQNGCCCTLKSEMQQRAYAVTWRESCKESSSLFCSSGDHMTK
jgi:hypothetical protein